VQQIDEMIGRKLRREAMVDGVHRVDGTADFHTAPFAARLLSMPSMRSRGERDRRHNPLKERPMTRAKSMLILAVAAAGICLPTFTRAADAKELTGTLIDNMCGEKKTDEAAAAGHKAACAVKCADSGYQLIVGDKHYKFDDKGNEKAKEYLKDNKELKVTVEAKADGEKLEVASIKAAEKKSE
jgi:hypothetical protein